MQRECSICQRESPKVLQIIHFWTGVQDVNNAAWIAPLLFLLVVIQYFGVRGYGEVCSSRAYRS